MALLEVNDLYVSYGAIRALHGLTFYVDEGEIVTLIGANGAGKTTTLKAITAVLPVNAGSISFLGFGIMAVLMLPGFGALADGVALQNVFGSEVAVVSIFGLPLTVFNYSSQVFPPLLMAGVLGPLYKLLKKVIPDNLQLIFVPFLAMLVMLPLTAFLIGPIAQFWLIPFMNTDAGRQGFSWLLGDGQARGIALVFVLSGVLGLALTGLAFGSRSYRLLSERYGEPTADAEPIAESA